jgi:hypothetical protein
LPSSDFKKGYLEGLKRAEEIARADFLTKGLSGSVRERTRVRKFYANKIAAKIRKEIASL